MNLASVNGSTMVSKTTRRGSNPWRGAKFVLGLLMFVSTCAYSHNTHHKHKRAKVVKTEKTSVLVFNNTKNIHEYSKMTNVIRPIASVTKLMTAMVALNYDKNMERHLNINSSVGGSLPRNRSYSRYDLLNAMLVKSDNSAAETFSTDYPGGRKAFLDEMNRLALEYGMISTHFNDPTGLSVENQASAIDVATMVARASEYDLIREISTKKQIEIDTQHKKKIRTIVLNNTNRPVLFEFDSIIVSKTGFTNPAGYCLALAVDKNNQKYSVVILGARDKYDRIRKVEDIMYNHINDTN
jgi:D-alanyl-D-alanine endopeptidase (penicillin-binding protein 7)